MPVVAVLDEPLDTFTVDLESALPSSPCGRKRGLGVLPAPFNILTDSRNYEWSNVAKHWVQHYELKIVTVSSAEDDGEDAEPASFNVPLLLPSRPEPVKPIHIEGISRCHLNVWVDAATSWGIGIIVNKHWAAWKLQKESSSLKCPCHNIGWLEALAIELAVYILVHNFRIKDAAICVHGDNLSILHAFLGERCRNDPCQGAIARTKSALERARLALIPTHVPSAFNLADPISRGIRGPAERRLACAFALPAEYAACLRQV